MAEYIWSVHNVKLAPPFSAVRTELVIRTVGPNEQREIYKA